MSARPPQTQQGAGLTHAVDTAHDVKHKLVERRYVVDQAGDTQVSTLTQPVGPQRFDPVAPVVTQIVQHLLACSLVFATHDVGIHNGQDWLHRMARPF